MVADERKNSALLLDKELEALWREGLDDVQYDRVQGAIAAQAKVEIPENLKSRLLRIPSTEHLKDIAESKFWLMPSLKYVPVSILCVALILVGYYLKFHELPFSASSSTQISMKADRFLEGLIEEDSSNDIFDRDISMLERLS